MIETQEKNGLLESHSNLTGELIGKLQERYTLVNALTEMKDSISVKRQAWQLRLAEMDKDELKEFGSNADIRNAKIENELRVENEAIRIFEKSLKSLELEIEIIKIQLRHVVFEKDVLLAKGDF